MKIDMETRYFIFGEYVCRIYEETFNIVKVINKINEENLDYSIFEFIPNVTDVIDLMWKYNGYNNYCVITKQEYDLLVNL
jgi:hypothetical protein